MRMTIPDLGVSRNQGVEDNEEIMVASQTDDNLDSVITNREHIEVPVMSSNVRMRRLFHSPSHRLAYQMPPNPFFQVNLPPKQQGHYPLPMHPPMTTCFALSGTMAERKLQRKPRQKSNFNKSYHVQKTRLADWNINAPSTNAPPSLTTITHGMSTSQTPLRLLDMAHSMETEEYVERVDCAQSTAQQYTLGSPISLSRIPPKVPTLDESEAAETLLSLFSVRLESPALQIEDYHTMDIVSEIQAPTPAGLSVTTALDTPPLPLLIPGDLSSSSGLLIEDHNMDIDPEIQASITGVSTAPDTPFIVPGENLPSSSGWVEHQDSASNDQIEPEIDAQVIIPRLRKKRTSRVKTTSFTTVTKPEISPREQFSNLVRIGTMTSLILPTVLTVTRAQF